jgi:predicted TPR repeat methyltransferase
MAAREAVFDLVVAVDTLCYFGALPPVFRAAARTLRRGGRLVFTLERAEDELPDRGFTLGVHGRYAHSEASVRAAFATAGFGDVTIAGAVLGKERLEDVMGLLVSARREALAGAARHAEGA